MQPLRGRNASLGLIGYNFRELRIRAVSKPGIEMDYHLMTVAAFMQSYDRDVLDLQDDPASYINEIETQLAQKNGASMGRDLDGNLVWPVAVMKAHLGIHGEPQWPEVSLRL